MGGAVDVSRIAMLVVNLLLVRILIGQILLKVDSSSNSYSYSSYYYCYPLSKAALRLCRPQARSSHTEHVAMNCRIVATVLYRLIRKLKLGEATDPYRYSAEWHAKLRAL